MVATASASDEGTVEGGPNVNGRELTCTLGLS